MRAPVRATSVKIGNRLLPNIFGQIGRTQPITVNAAQISALKNSLDYNGTTITKLSNIPSAYNRVYRVLEIQARRKRDSALASE